MPRLEEITRFLETRPLPFAVTSGSLVFAWGVMLNDLRSDTPPDIKFLVAALLTSAVSYMLVQRNEEYFWHVYRRVKEEGYPLVVKDKNSVPYARAIAKKRGELDDFEEALNIHTTWNAQR